MPHTNPNREAQTIRVVDDAHREILHHMFMACRGRLHSFHLANKQWRFDTDQFLNRVGETIPLREVINESSIATRFGNDEAILRGQWASG